MRRVGVILVCAILSSIASFGCKRLSTGAREEFGKTYSCPEDRIVVKARDDLKWATLVYGGQKKEDPPAEVAKDPARLAKWKSDQDEKVSKSHETLNDKVDVFQVTGCDHDVLMGCWQTGGGRGTSGPRVACQESRAKP